MPVDAQRIVGSLAVLAAAGCAPFRAARVPSPPLAGTYELFVCKHECPLGDSSRAFAIGRLVLDDTAIVLTPRPDSSDVRLGWRRWQLRAPPTGCFIIDERKSERRSYAGISRVDVISWRIDAARDSAFSFTLYLSPDASHVATLVRANERGVLRGTGRSSGVGATEVDWPDDSVVARRVGPPDVESCFTAAAVEWRKRSRSTGR
jgi:hypothetical protein